MQKKDLIKFFENSFKNTNTEGIGTEHEKFIFICQNKQRIQFKGDKSIQSLFHFLMNEGWVVGDKSNEDIISLKKNEASITLEPGCQLELSGKIMSNIHDTCTEVHSHLNELNDFIKKNDLCVIGLGFDPISKIEDIDWIPKKRYQIMKKYMPKVGTRGLNMMTRTCTVQANFDYHSHDDLTKKFVVANRVHPFVMAMFLNSPFFENDYNGFLSNRLFTWQDTDKERCGIKKEFLDQNFSIEEYVDYVINVKNYFLTINGNITDTTNYSFKQILDKNTNDSDINNYDLTISDFENHLSTIFTEVRLKSYMEVRGADAGKWEMICALPALWTGLLYDNDNLDYLFNLTKDWNEYEIMNLYEEVPKLGYNCRFQNHSINEFSKDILQISKKGLQKRGFLNSKGQDETIHLDQLEALILNKKCPANILLEEFHANNSIEKVLNKPYY